MGIESGKIGEGRKPNHLAVVALAFAIVQAACGTHGKMYAALDKDDPTGLPNVPRGAVVPSEFANLSPEAARAIIHDEKFFNSLEVGERMEVLRALRSAPEAF